MSTVQPVEERDPTFQAARERRLELGRQFEETKAELARLEAVLRPGAEKPEAAQVIEAVRRLPKLREDRQILAAEIPEADKEVQAACRAARVAAVPALRQRGVEILKKQLPHLEALQQLEREKQLWAEDVVAVFGGVQQTVGLDLAEFCAPEILRVGDDSLMDLRKRRWTALSA